MSLVLHAIRKIGGDTAAVAALLAVTAGPLAAVAACASPTAAPADTTHYRQVRLGPGPTVLYTACDGLTRLYQSAVGQELAAVPDATCAAK